METKYFMESIPPELADCLLEGYREIAGDALLEGVFADFGRKLIRGTIIAAMAMGLLTHAEAAPKKGSTYQKGKAAPTVTIKKKVKNTKSGSTTITKADLKNLTNSQAYQDRVTELLTQMTSQDSSANPDQIYQKACSQAMMEIMQGKLKI